MQNVYIVRDRKKIQLTADEIKSAWVAYDAELRDEQLEIYKEKVKGSLKLLSVKEHDCKYTIIAGNDEIVEEIARDIRRSIENGCDEDWCFITDKYGGFREHYDSAIEAYEEMEG